VLIDIAAGVRPGAGLEWVIADMRLQLAEVIIRHDPSPWAPDGTVQKPTRWERAGWYAPGTRPGDPGSAVILGHVDSKRGPAVFFRLRELRRGDMVTIGRADGSSVRFVVQRTQQHLKDRFPTDDVYYPTLAPALRLVTCGGEFDATIGRYRSNLIVFATMAPNPPARCNALTNELRRSLLRSTWHWAGQPSGWNACSNWRASFWEAFQWSAGTMNSTL
jgi:hypothetical protein